MSLFSSSPILSAHQKILFVSFKIFFVSFQKLMSQSFCSELKVQDEIDENPIWHAEIL